MRLVIARCSVDAEGSASDWLSLAAVEGHGVDKPTGAVIFGVFVTAMTVGRLAGPKVLDHFGRVPVLRASAALAALGLLVFIFVPMLWVAIVGVVLWGLGSALGFLGEHFGLLRALLLVFVLIAIAGLASGAARERHPASLGPALKSSESDRR